jgi:Lar family restriction alleviation protein
MKTCPHCGGDDLEVIQNPSAFPGYLSVRCRACGDLGPPSLSEEGAMDWWNTRHDKGSTAQHP